MGCDAPRHRRRPQEKDATHAGDTAMTEIRLYQTLTPRHRSILWRLLASIAESWNSTRRARANRRALEDLDEAGLRDIGLSRSAQGYIPAHGLDERNRRRIVSLGTSFGLWR
jgi:uncharacterized protein YjiS (DUF1127 family)